MRALVLAILLAIAGPIIAAGPSNASASAISGERHACHVADSFVTAAHFMRCQPRKADAGTPVMTSGKVNDLRGEADDGVPRDRPRAAQRAAPRASPRPNGADPDEILRPPRPLVA